MDNLGGVRSLIDRHGLPPGIERVVQAIEKANGPLEVPPAKGREEVRALMQMVDGTNLIACIVAHIASGDGLQVAEPPARPLRGEPITPPAFLEDEDDTRD